MLRLHSMVWILGSMFAAGAALAVTLAQAADGQITARVDRWSAEDKAVLASLSLKRLPPAPVDSSNAVERLPAAVDLGKRLFNDVRFSRNGAVSCASCHDSQKQFQDGLPVGQGVGTGLRRTMPIVGAGYSAWLFWDGRKDSVWAQALGPLEDAVEHGGNRTRYAHLLAEHYRKDYESLFKALPRIDGLPRDAGPNGSAAEQAAWLAMDVRQREDVSRVFSNMGKAIAAYEKSLQHEPSRLDRYVDAVVANDPAAQGTLRANEVKGLRLFIGKAQCVTCHNGPLFTDQQFHNTGVPPHNFANPERGRAAATAKVHGDEFNCLGPFSDARPAQCQELRFMVSEDPALEGAFKTPGLRGVAQRPPYMHAGQIATLEQVVRHYVEAPHAKVGHSELTHTHASKTKRTQLERAPIELSNDEAADLVSFLGTLSSEPPAEPAVKGSTAHLGADGADGSDGAGAPDRYAAAADGRIYFRSAGLGSGPPLVLVSGGPGGSHTSFMPWFSRLEDRRQLVYFDNIGRGRSDRLPPSQQHSVPRDARDIEALRDALKAPKILLLGNSYGALPAIEYALQHPDRVACLVLSSGMHSEVSFQDQIDALNRAVTAQFPEHWDRLQALSARGVLSGDDAYQAVFGEVVDRLYWSDPRNAARRRRSPDPRDRFDPATYAAFMGPDSERSVGGRLKGYDPRPRMRALRVPTLVVTGRRDVVATPRIGAETVAAFAPGVARLEIIEDAGHRPFIEQTEAYFDQVSRFLDTTPACGGKP